MTAKQFEDDGYNVITVALHTHPVGKEWSFDQLNASECVAVVGKKMVRHPSTFILFQPFVNHIFLET
jgi:hypothetical protein